MPRGRKKTTMPVETPVTTEATTGAPVTSPHHVAPEPVAPPTAAADDGFRAELGASDPATPVAATPVAATPVAATPETAAPAPRGRFRSWVVDTTRGYTRLTDEQEQRIVLQFAQKPAADVLTAIKGAGFQFLADYEGLNHVWVRRNDFETRLQVEAIEKLIGTVPSRESVPR